VSVSVSVCVRACVRVCSGVSLLSGSSQSQRQEQEKFPAAPPAAGGPKYLPGTRSRLCSQSFFTVQSWELTAAADVAVNADVISTIKETKNKNCPGSWGALVT
jgi:hypothetical protein